jgi:Domain of unknown function (DUF3786)
MCGDRWLEELDGPVPRNYREAYRRACALMQGRDPRIDAETAGVAFVEEEPGRGHWEIPLLNQAFTVSWPDLAVREIGTGTEPSYVVQLLLLHYLYTSDGITVRGQWASFRDLPDGRSYYPAFRGGSEERLRQRFGRDPDGLARAAAALGGRPAGMADLSFAFQLLPRLPLAVLLWKGDDEFEPELHLLYDVTAANYLPTEDLAVIARYFTACLLRAVPNGG